MCGTRREISVVVPRLPGADALTDFHSTLVRTLVRTRRAFEICYVDDGSRDGTRARLTALCASDHRVRHTSFSRAFGREAALLAGARMARGEAVILMDADLRHPPELLPRLLEFHRLGYDQVVARLDRGDEGRVRAAVRAFGRRALGRLTGVGAVDGPGDFRLLSRRAVDSVLSLPESNRYSEGIFSWIGYPTVSFSYRNTRGPVRGGGNTRGSALGRGVEGVISFNSRPLRLALHTGIALFLAALGYAVWVVLDALLRQVAVPGHPTLLTAVVALGGIQLVTLGVIGEYVGRIHHEAKHRPHYVVYETDESPAAPPCPDPQDVPDAPDAPAVRDSPDSPDSPGARTADPTGTPRTVRQFALFAAIGCVNTAVYLAVYVSAHHWIPYLAAHVLGYAVSVVVSFLLNSWLTCRTRPTWRAFARYPASGVAGLVGAGILLQLAVGVLGMDKNISAVAAGVLVTPFSFLLARWAITSGAVAPSGRQR